MSCPLGDQCGVDAGGEPALAKGWIGPRVRLHQKTGRVLAAQPTCIHWNTITASVPVPPGVRSPADERDFLAACLYGASLIRRIGWDEQRPASSPTAARRYCGALAALQTELQLAPDAETTYDPRMRAIGDLAETIGASVADAAVQALEQHHIRAAVDDVTRRSEALPDRAATYSRALVQPRLHRPKGPSPPI